VKKLIFLISLCSCFTTFAGRDTAFTKENSRFHELVVQNKELGFTNIPYEFPYALTENEVVAVGWGGDPDSGLTGPVLTLLDKKKNEVRFESKIYDNSEGWELYEFRTESHVFLLFENEYEYNSMLSLFVFNLKSREFAFVGDFDVSEDPPSYAEYTPYPVQDIEIVPSDSLVNFIFNKRLMLHPGFENWQALDSLIYELNLHNGLLRPTQTWEAKEEK
jgi:hypothetical protein